MANEIDIVVPNPRMWREGYDQIAIFRAPTLAGTYVEITSASTRLALREDKIDYVFYDPVGVDTDYYRYQFFDSRSVNAPSAQTEPTQGQTDPALDVLSIAELKTNYLFGVNLLDDFGNEMPPSLFRHFIRGAVALVERELGTPLRPRAILAERHNHYPEDFVKFQRFNTFFYPIISVEAVRATLPGQTQMRTYDPSWIQADLEPGVIEIVPGAGGLPFAGIQTLVSPSLFSGLSRSVPHTIEIDYTAGFPRGQVPEDIRVLVGMVASYGPLNLAGDLLGGAGVASYSVGLDGLSQSVSTTSSATSSGYGARLIQYAKDMKRMLPLLKAYYRGIRAEAG